jgi:AraC-like DNA-binding protein
LIFLREIPNKVMSGKELNKRNYNRRRLEQIFTFIHDNYEDMDISLEQAAKAAALSKFHFTRFFKIETGQTFHAYLSKVRVSRAMEELIQSDTPITSVSYNCGFASVKTFNRLFKHYTGVSPSDYRVGKKSNL